MSINETKTKKGNVIYKTGMQFIHLLLTNFGNCYVTIVISLLYNRSICNRIFEVKEGPLMVNLYWRCFYSVGYIGFTTLYYITALHHPVHHCLHCKSLHCNELH